MGRNEDTIGSEEASWDDALRVAWGSRRSASSRGPFARVRELHTLPPGPLLLRVAPRTPPGVGQGGRRVDRYTLVGEIAHGRATCIHKAYDHELGREVALQALKAEQASDPKEIRGFLDSIQLRGQLEHPGILPIHDVGVMDGDVPYLTMPLLVGRTLDLLVETPLATRLDVLTRAAQTVAYAHSRGVVHGALAEHAVQRGPHGEVHVIDWGCARRLDDGADTRVDVEALRGLLRRIVSEIPTEVGAKAVTAADLASALETYGEAGESRARSAEVEAAEARARSEEHAARLARARVEAEEAQHRWEEAAAARRHDREQRAAALHDARRLRRRAVRRTVTVSCVLALLALGTWAAHVLLASARTRRLEADTRTREALARARAAAGEGAWAVAAREAESARWLAEDADEDLASRAEAVSLAYAEENERHQARRAAEARQARAESEAFEQAFVPWLEPADAKPPVPPPPSFRKALESCAAGHADRALASLQDAIAADPNVWLVALDAHLSEAQGDLARAVRGWTALLVLRSGSAVPWLRLADVELRRDRAARALELVQRAERVPILSSAMRAYADAVRGATLLQTGSFADGLRALEDAQAAGAPEGRLALAKARDAARYEADGDYDTAPPALAAWMLLCKGRAAQAARLLSGATDADVEADSYALTLLHGVMDREEASDSERTAWSKRVRTLLTGRPLPAGPLLRSMRLPSVLATLPTKEADAWRDFWEARQ